MRRRMTMTMPMPMLMKMKMTLSACALLRWVSNAQQCFSNIGVGVGLPVGLCLEMPQALTKLASPIATGKDISAYSMGFADITCWTPTGKIPDGINL